VRNSTSVYRVRRYADLERLLPRTQEAAVGGSVWKCAQSADTCGRRWPL